MSRKANRTGAAGEAEADVCEPARIRRPWRRRRLGQAGRTDATGAADLRAAMASASGSRLATLWLKVTRGGIQGPSYRLTAEDKAAIYVHRNALAELVRYVDQVVA